MSIARVLGKILTDVKEIWENPDGYKINVISINNPMSFSLEFFSKNQKYAYLTQEYIVEFEDSSVVVRLPPQTVSVAAKEKGGIEVDFGRINLVNNYFNNLAYAISGSECRIEPQKILLHGKKQQEAALEALLEEQFPAK